ncbi:MAG: hypothetical protein LQ344_000191 [Seirophora lacunosa]|nr:MAG: hypothetical protein LQ344_000191 [Seirophora lacunosa]
MDHSPAPEDNLPEETAQPFKRRKFYRKRLGSPSSESGPAAFPATSNTIASSYTAPEQLAQNSSLSDAEQHITGPPQRTVAEILKHRKAAQRRRGGIEFTNSTHVGESSIDTAAHADQLLDNEDSLGKILTVVDRFAPQIGQVADVDKHMYAAPKSSVPPLELQTLTV